MFDIIKRWARAGLPTRVPTSRPFGHSAPFRVESSDAFFPHEVTENWPVCDALLEKVLPVTSSRAPGHGGGKKLHAHLTSPAATPEQLKSLVERLLYATTLFAQLGAAAARTPDEDDLAVERWRESSIVQGFDP